MNGIEHVLENGYSSGWAADPQGTEQTAPGNARQFQDLLTVMMFSSQLDGMQSETLTGTSSLFGGDMMMPLMLSLMEQLIGMQMEGDANDMNPMEVASLVQINQFDAEKELGGDGANANCGPASLAMALKYLGAVSPSLSSGSLVDAARRLMVDDPSRDGVYAGGGRAENEHSSYTSLSEIAQGAQRAGVYAQRVDASSDTVVRALQMGGSVIVSGTFRGKDPLPWTGDTSRDFNSAPGGATEHFVFISGYDDRTGKLIISDPARHSPIAVYPHTLDYFMQGNDGALVLHG